MLLRLEYSYFTQKSHFLLCKYDIHNMNQSSDCAFFHNNVILAFQVGRGGKPKYNDHIIDGGGGLETAKNG